MTDGIEMLRYIICHHVNVLLLWLGRANFPRNNPARRATECIVVILTWLHMSYAVFFIANDIESENPKAVTGIGFLFTAVSVATFLIITGVNFLKPKNGSLAYRIFLFNYLLATELLIMSLNLITVDWTKFAAAIIIIGLLSVVEHSMTAMDSLIVMQTGCALCAVFLHFYFDRFHPLPFLLVQNFFLAPHLDLCSLLALTLPAVQLFLNALQNTQDPNFALPMRRTDQAILQRLPGQ